MSVELDGQQLLGLIALGLLVGYFIGCLRAAYYVERNSKRNTDRRQPW